ncbi:MAG: molybdenum cofactor biosynthesis protein MoaE [Nocardioides sp.]
MGDVAVVCATATGHRGESFDATRALIDTLKDEVPIWKHPMFADGTEEWVGSP